MERGITLIALVLTIVILLILAGITINLLMTETGIFESANRAKIAHEIGELKDRMGVRILDWSAEKVFTPDLSINNLWDKFIEDDIINVREDVKPSEDKENVYEVSTKKGYLVEIIVHDDGRVTIGEIVEEDKLLPRISEITVTNKTTNSIDVQVKVSRLLEGKLTYLYKKDTEPESSYKELKKDITDLTASYTGLEQNVIYNIKVVAENKNGKTEKTVNELTGEVPKGTISQKGETVWKNGKASIELETSETGYTLQYQINSREGVWQEYTGAIGNLNHGDIVYARLYDGINGSDTAIVNIEDGKAPVVTVTKGNVITNSIAVSVTATDEETGMIATPSYSYYIKKHSDASYPTTASYTGTNTSYTFTGLQQTTGYDIKVTTKDKANNEGTGSLSNVVTGTIGGATEGLVTGNITASAVSWSGGKASITLTTTTELQIEWQKGGISGSWTKGTSVTGLSHGNVVYARLTDGTNVGDYASINVQDGLAPQAATISLSSTSATAGTAINATITHRDNESGIVITNCKWVYNTNPNNIGTNATSYTGGTFSSNPQTISLNTSTPGTYYLHVLSKDAAENKKETVSGAITVRQLATGISLNQTTASIYTGATLQLTATITPNNTSNKGVTWTSSNPAVATVNSSGLVTGIVTGTVSITVRTNDGSNKTASCSVTVKGRADGSYSEEKGVNTPKLGAGMTPIKWNGNEWVTTTIDDNEWYDYSTTAKKWANAQTADRKYVGMDTKI